MILDEIRIHKYTHTNYKLSVLNIKYYNFCSSFNTIEFYSGKLYVDAEAIHSTIQGKHLALRCRPQKLSMPMVLLVRGPTVKPEPLTGNRPQHHRKGEENYMYTVRSTRQRLIN
jgi:hypothetical protein